MLCGQHAFNTFFLSCLSLAVLLHHMQGVELCMHYDPALNRETSDTIVVP